MGTRRGIDEVHAQLLPEDKVAEAMRPFGGDILQTSLSIKDEEELKCELGKC